MLCIFPCSESWCGYVVKASGLAAGKGVVVTTSVAEALEAVDTVSSSFGVAGDTLVVEELLEGEEVSVSCFKSFCYCFEYWFPIALVDRSLCCFLSYFDFRMYLGSYF